MGEIAKTLVALSGPDSVHGIIPEALVRYERDPNYTSTKVNGDIQKDAATTTEGDQKEDKQFAVPDENVFGRTTIVKDMHTRKLMMAQEVLAGGPGSGFIAMSGGYGTMEELFETVTWNQLGIHDKGIVLLNINGFYDGILQWIQNSIREGFVNEANGKIMVEAKNPEDAIRALKEYKVSEAVLKLKWSDE